MGGYSSEYKISLVSGNVVYQFLDKTKIALENLKIISKSRSFNVSDSKLLEFCVLLKRLYLSTLISFIFKKTERIIERNLLSKRPSLLLFDFYKLGCYCLKSSS